MRTPLNAILGMTNLLNGTNLNMEQREYLAIDLKQLKRRRSNFWLMLVI